MLVNRKAALFQAFTHRRLHSGSSASSVSSSFSASASRSKKNSSSSSYGARTSVPKHSVESLESHHKVEATMDVLLNVVQHLGVVPAPALDALERDRHDDPRRVVETCQQYLRCARRDEDEIETVVLIPAWEQLCRWQYWRCRQAAKLLQRYKNERMVGVAGMWDKVCAAQQDYHEIAEELSACELGLYKAKRRHQARSRRNSGTSSASCWLSSSSTSLPSSLSLSSRRATLS